MIHCIELKCSVWQFYFPSGKVAVLLCETVPGAGLHDVSLCLTLIVPSVRNETRSALELQRSAIKNKSEDLLKEKISSIINSQNHNAGAIF